MVYVRDIRKSGLMSKKEILRIIAGIKEKALV
jgi:hypothetical protein